MPPTRRQDGAHEIGRPSYATVTLGHLVGQHRAQLRRKGAVQRWWTVAAVWVVVGVGLVVAGVASGRVWVETALLLVGLAGSVMWSRRPWIKRPPVLNRWELWARINGDMVAALRSDLGPEWSVLWDRRVPDWRDPVTFAVGPGGLWALWCAPPDQPSARVVCEAVVPKLAELFAGEGVTITARVADLDAPATWWETVTSSMVVTPLVLGAGDVRRLVGRIEAETLADMEGLPDAR